eukprot:1146616-Pelagomonas_calceolata.AAC.1
MGDGSGDGQSSTSSSSDMEIGGHQTVVELRNVEEQEIPAVCLVHANVELSEDEAAHLENRGRCFSMGDDSEDEGDDEHKCFKVGIVSLRISLTLDWIVQTLRNQWLSDWLDVHWRSSCGVQLSKTL